MNKREYTNDHRSYIPACRSNLLPAVLLLLATAPAIADDSYQQRMLFNPTDSMLKAEARGRIMIYDGMDRNTVDRAMDEQFDRIDNMMFTRIRSVNDDGEYEVDDDGC